MCRLLLEENKGEKPDLYPGLGWGWALALQRGHSCVSFTDRSPAGRDDTLVSIQSCLGDAPAPPPLHLPHLRFCSHERREDDSTEQVKPGKAVLTHPAAPAQTLLRTRAPRKTVPKTSPWQPMPPVLRTTGRSPAADWCSSRSSARGLGSHRTAQREQVCRDYRASREQTEAGHRP